MNKINWWMVIALSLGAAIILLLAASWLALDWTEWESGRSVMYDATPRTHGIWRVPFSPLMSLMPFAWLVFPIFGVVCMIRWFSGEPRWRYYRTRHESVATCSNCGHSLGADWQVCPYCGQPLKSREARDD
jgi:hypothetical protein